MPSTKTKKPTCPNLIYLFGDKYRVAFIYPHGPGRLGVCIDRRRYLSADVDRLPGVTLHQDGDNEKTFTFDLAAFDAVAELVKPRRRFKMSEKQRQHLDRVRGAGLAALKALAEPSDVL